MFGSQGAAALNTADRTWLPSQVRDNFVRASIMLRLESEDLVLELANRTRLVVAERFGGLLEATNHRGRAADEDLDIVGRLGQPLLCSCQKTFSKEKIVERRKKLTVIISDVT
jgi:hypothetical protein